MAAGMLLSCSRTVVDFHRASVQGVVAKLRNYGPGLWLHSMSLIRLGQRQMKVPRLRPSLWAFVIWPISRERSQRFCFSSNRAGDEGKRWHWG